MIWHGYSQTYWITQGSRIIFGLLCKSREICLNELCPSFSPSATIICKTKFTEPVGCCWQSAVTQPSPKQSPVFNKLGITATTPKHFPVHFLLFRTWQLVSYCMCTGWGARSGNCQSHVCIFIWKSISWVYFDFGVCRLYQWPVCKQQVGLRGITDLSLAVACLNSGSYHCFLTNSGHSPWGEVFCFYPLIFLF